MPNKKEVAVVTSERVANTALDVGGSKVPKQKPRGRMGKISFLSGSLAKFSN